MENFTYIDIFSTKGVEYIVVIIFLILIVWFWKFIKDENNK
jgi:glycine cleavage system H protein